MDAPAAEVAAAPDLQIAADRVEWKPGHLVASGNVRVDYGDQHLEAAEASWQGGSVLRLREGVLRRPEGELRFAAAEIWLEERGGDLVDVEVELADGRLVAGRLTLGAEAWSVQDGEIEPCRCADGKPPALDFAARGATLVPGKYVVIRGGAIRIFDLPILPVPWWREPLDPRRFRLLFPEVGHGSPGWSVALGGTGAVGDWRFSGGPAWREDRGFRGELSVDGPVGARGQLGWDFETDGLRGAGSTKAGFAKPLRLAWEASGQTDTDYADDYGVDWVARGVDWRDSRATIGWKGAQLGGWIGDDGSVGSFVRGRYRPVFGRAAWVAPWVGGGLRETPWGAAGLDGGASGTLGPVHAEATVATAVRTDAALASAGSGRVELPLWADFRGGRLRLWPGALAEGGLGWKEALAGAVTGVGGGVDGALELGDDPDWGLGPALRAQLVAGDAVLHGEVVGRWDGSWAPRASLDLSTGPVSAWFAGDLALQAGGLSWSSVVSGSVGAVRGEGLAVAWGSTDLRLGRLLLGGGVAGDLEAPAWSGASAQIGYDDGCSSLILSAAFSPDRALPDLGAKLVLRK